MYKIAQGKPIKDIDFNIVIGKRGRYRQKLICDNIFTCDIETTSSFVIDGIPKGFNYDNPDLSKNSYRHSLCYLWQFGIDDNIYYGRELVELTGFLLELKAYCPEYKIVYIHNLSFDINFLQNVLSFDEVFARTPRHPITALVKYFNIEFRCSYQLTHLSLDSWGKKKKLKYQKKIGQLDYSLLRTPKTPLSAEELEYSVFDLLVMYEGLKEYKAKYGHIYDIPLTQTGEMRREAEKRMRAERQYNKTMALMLPRTLAEYDRYIKSFIGGTCLCNFLYKNRVIEDVESWDIASSYPTVMLLEKYPVSPFYKTSKPEKYMNNDKYVYLIQFKCEHIESNYNCHWLSKSKIINKDFKVSVDNGRVIEGSNIELTLTNVDYEMFKKCYTVTGETLIDFRFARAGYLNNTFRKFILELYGNKTSLKGVDEELYSLSKQLINSAYGDMVTRILSDDIVYTNGEWAVDKLTIESFEKKLNKLRNSRKPTYKAFQQGLYVTAYAKRNLWQGITYEDKNGRVLDDYMCYCDTDSLKVRSIHGTNFFEEYNERMLKRHKEVAKDLGVSVELFRPKDPQGEEHPLGVFTYEGTYKKFKSLGAKQYIVETDKGLYLTCAGVSKKAVSCFKDIDDFNITRTLTEKELKECGAEKLIPEYSTNYTAVTYPDGYISKYKCGVNLMPTTFNLKITPEDLQLLTGEVMAKLTNMFLTGRYF